MPIDLHGRAHAAAAPPDDRAAAARAPHDDLPSLDLLRALPWLGSLRIETENVAAAIESVADYGALRIERAVGRVDTPSLHLRVRLAAWARARTIAAAGEAPGWCVEFTDAAGHPLHRVHLADPIAIAAFADVLAALREARGPLAHGSSPRLPIPLHAAGRAPASAPPREAGARDVRAAWFSLVGPAQGGALVRHHAATRGRVLRAIGDSWARRLSPDALPRALAAAHAAGVALAITVGNDGVTHTATGAWRLDGVTPEAVVARCATARSTLRTAPDAACWAVREPRADAAVWCLEAHDGAGDLVLGVDVVDTDDAAATAAWARILGAEPGDART